MKKYFLIAVYLLALMLAAGCSKTTGVMPWSETHYSVSADVDKTVFTKPSDAEQLAYKEASRFCSALGQGVNVRNFRHMETWTHYSVKLIFRCIPSKEETQAEKEGFQKVDVEML